MKKYPIVFILAILLFATSCDSSSKPIHYTFSDSRASFSIDYPRNWELIERIGAEGDAEHDASPDTGIEFDFSTNENETDIFFIRAMLFSSLSFDRENYEQADFMTDDNLPVTVYTQINNEDKSISVIYMLGKTEPPCYFGGVNMTMAAYDKYKGDILQVIKSFKIID